jgi:hypothetical protein
MHALQVAGTVAADTLKIGNITVKNQGFGLVLSSSRDFLDISCDGLFVRSRTPCRHHPLCVYMQHQFMLLRLSKIHTRQCCVILQAGHEL